MRSSALWLALAALAWPAQAAERTFDFSQVPLDQTPPGFRSAVAGEGRPGEWKVILDDAPSQFQPLTPNAPAVSKKAVLAQLALQKIDEHFPLLIFEEENFGDFRLTTRFKTVSGEMEQMAGIAFRIQDEKNFYVVRASSLGNTFRFYKVVNGQRGPLIGPELEIARGVWHELTLECKGNQVRCWLNGTEPFPALTDNSFASGRIGFWTKSDSVSYFADTRITYTPREAFAQRLIRDVLKEYPRLVGLRIYAPAGNEPQPQVIASSNAREIGAPGGKPEQDVLHSGAIYHSKGKQTVAVTMPLRDRNGDAVAAVRVEMKTFAGQTEQNALARALPIIKTMQARIQSAKDLAE